MIQIINDTVKAHGGELKVESKEGEGREFVIQLMVTSKKNFLKAPKLKI